MSTKDMINAALNYLRQNCRLTRNFWSRLIMIRADSELGFVEFVLDCMDVTVYFKDGKPWRYEVCRCGNS